MNGCSWKIGLLGELLTAVIFSPSSSLFGVYGGDGVDTDVSSIS